VNNRQDHHYPNCAAVGAKTSSH